MALKIPVIQHVPPVSALSHPFIIDNAAQLLGWPDCHKELQDLSFFLNLSSSDIVPLSHGRAYDSDSVYVNLAEGIKEILDCDDAQERYITGWEYEAGDCGDLLSKYGLSVDCWEGGCVLGTSVIPGLRQVSELMKWFFIGSSSTSSGQHVDPLHSNGWMFLFSGSKTWRISQSCNDGDCAHYEGTLYPGQLIFVPGGCLHEVQNGSGVSVAVTHNWVPPAIAPLLWVEIQSALATADCLDSLAENPEIDSLLFGVIASLARATKAQREAFAVCDSSSRATALEALCRF
jgi:hypothetical protein